MASNVDISGTEIVYTGDPGDNTLTVTQAGAAYTFDDSLAISGCDEDSVDPTMSTCTPPAEATLIRIDAGDGNDGVTVNASTPAEINCGPGDDTAIFDPGDTLIDCEHQDDRVPPDTTITAGPDEVVGSRDQSFTFTSEPGATFTCSLAGPNGSKSIACPSSPANLGAADLTDDGKYTFGVAATDAFGHPDPTPATWAFTLDTIFPQAIVTRLVPFDRSTAYFQLDAAPGDTGVSFKCAVGTAAQQPCADIFTTPALPDGDYSLSVTATDAAGNSSPVTVPFKINARSGAPPAQPRRIIIQSLVLIAGNPVKMSRHGIVRITLTCAGTIRCKGRMRITTAEPVRGKGRKLVTLGSKRFAIAANKKRKVNVRFSKGKVRLARKLKRFKAKVVINEVDPRGNPRISSRVFVLRAR